MGRFLILLMFVCVVSYSRATPIAEKAPAAPEEALPVPTPEKEIVKNEEVPTTEQPAKVEAVEDKTPAPQKPEEAPANSSETPTRDARTLGSRAEANEIGGTDEVEDALLQKLSNKCSKRDFSSCVMIKLVTYMNRLLKKSNIEVIDGLHITQTTSEVQVEEESLPRSASGGEGDEESEVTNLLYHKLWSFVKTRSLRWNVLPDADMVVSTSPDDEGTVNVGMSIRTAKALEKGLALKGLALLVGKALLVSKIALLLASILWLKKLFSHQKHVTYEVVAHPHHTHSTEHHGDSYSSGWGRSTDTEKAAAHQLAYNAYIPAATPH
ncbi:hypothetical protein C0J52_17074 [Blattella germanica]|nr:hypothetical protein C0J52_17074 [Blattella germanica]